MVVGADGQCCPEGKEEGVFALCTLDATGAAHGKSGVKLPTNQPTTVLQIHGPTLTFGSQRQGWKAIDFCISGPIGS